LLFHDTHHRAVTDPKGMAVYDLANYDGVLAFGRVILDLYLERGWIQRAWTWHEAADVRVFKPAPAAAKSGDLVWIGNWGDEERTRELQEFLLEPARALGLTASAYGVRYPETGCRAMDDAGFTFHGWLPNYQVPRVFAQFKVTLHIPRRPYVKALRGIPTIRVFEALACGIPLVCSYWEDTEKLFTPGVDYLVARTPQEMQGYLREIVHNEEVARGLADYGLQTIRRRHTCAHRVNELLGICRELGLPVHGNSSRPQTV
jgi:spore maturation protein CgeB